MKTLSCIFLWFTSLSLSAQNNAKGDFRLGTSFTSDKNISSNRITISEYRWYLSEYDKPNYTIGFSAEYFFEHRLSFNLGFSYSNLDFTGSYRCITCDPSGIPDPNIEVRFITIPMIFRHYFLPKKLKLYIEAGVIQLYEITKNEFPKTNNINNNYSINGKFGGGIEYQFTSKLAIQTITTYNSGLTNIYRTSNFKFKTLSFGLGLMKRM